MSMLKGPDVHVAVTARDPARQLVSEWQEGVKHGRRLSFAEFEATVRAGQDGVAQHFRSAQDLPEVLSRWGHWLPADGRLGQPAYGQLARQRVAHELLAGGTSERPRLPLELYDALVTLGEQWAKEVDRAGYVVHGDLVDLVPVRPEQEPPHPDAVDAAAQVDVAAGVVAELLLDLAKAREDVAAKDAKRRSWKKRAKKLADRLAAET